jgi:hypothetical protein
MSGAVASIRLLRQERFEQVAVLEGEPHLDLVGRQRRLVGFIEELACVLLRDSLDCRTVFPNLVDKVVEVVR